MIGSFNGVMSAVQNGHRRTWSVIRFSQNCYWCHCHCGWSVCLSIGLIAVFGPMMMVGRAFGVVAMAARAMSMALLTNPITWIVLAIAGAAFLIYKIGPLYQDSLLVFGIPQNSVQWWYPWHFSTDYQLESNRTILFSICWRITLVRHWIFLRSSLALVP